MKKLLPLSILALLFSISALAQDFAYGTYSVNEIEMKKYDKDTSAHAVVLNEFGDARIGVNSDDNLRMYFTYHVKIKIIDNKGFKNGDVEIPIYGGDNNLFESVDEIKGVVYYTDDNGGFNKADLDPKKVYTVKQDKHWNTIKFAMPNLHPGCVIEYSYHLESPYFWDNFHSWQFQSDIPKEYSEYLVHIPAYFNYKAALRGGRKLTKNVAELETDCISIRGVKNACSKISYGMKDIPAFVEEDYMTSRKNYLAAVSFELEDYVDPYTGVKRKVTKEWADIDYQIKSNEDIGSQLKKKDLFKEKIIPVIANQPDELSKAKAVYAYIQKWFKWNNYIGIFSTDGIRKAIDLHSASVPDINISLIAALNAAGIKAEAVLLSTREHGAINTLYPGVGDFNYLIAKANIGEKSYLLDASDQLLPFNTLPMKCLNDKGRVFSLDKPSYWIDLDKTPQREDETYNIELALQDNGKMKGTITRFSIGYDSYLKRKEIKKFNTTDEYVENLDESLPRLKILKSDISNIDSLNLPLTEKYEVEINAYDNLNNNKLTFDPYLFSKVKVNPFKMTDRDYPVDWGMPSNDRYLITIHLPSGYEVESSPKNIAISLPNNGGKFVTSFVSEGNDFTFSYITQFNKSIYNPYEYPALKELYNKIIQTEKEEIVLKKK